MVVQWFYYRKPEGAVENVFGSGSSLGARSTSPVAGTSQIFSMMSVVCVACVAICISMPVSMYSGHGGHASVTGMGRVDAFGRELFAHDDVVDDDDFSDVNVDLVGRAHHHGESTLGQTLGWISGITYVVSRIPQLIKNIKRKSTEGLAKMLFVCAVAGNLTYGISIFVHPGGKEYLMESLPWLIGSLGTLAFDFCLLGMFYVWGSDTLDNLDVPLMSNLAGEDDNSCIAEVEP